MGNNNLFKYIFAAVIVIMVSYIIYLFVSKQSNEIITEVDQTSTTSTIHTDLRFAIASIDTFNPILTNNRNVLELTKIVYDPLVTLDSNYKPEYCLAEDVIKVDDVTYVIKVKRGIVFENNLPLNAYDVQYTIDLIKRGDIFSTYKENVKNIIGVAVPDEDPYQITINLSEPTPFFDYYLTFPIMSKTYYEGEDFASSLKVPVSTGMFKVIDYSSNMIKLAPNELYWNRENKKPMATEIAINLYDNIGEVYSAFKNGELDALVIKITNVEDYIGNLGYKKIEFKARNYDYLAINTQSDILSDAAVRRAISLLIDRNNVVATSLGKGYVASNFSLDMGSWLYTKDLTIESNSEEAFNILVNDGWTRTTNSWTKRIDGRTKRLEFSMVVNNNDEARMAAAETIKEQLSRAGIFVDLRIVNPDQYNYILSNKEFDTAIAGMRLGFSPSVRSFFGENNLANYYNDEVNNILNTVENTKDDGILHENYNRLFDIYMQDVPYIGLYRNTEIIVYNQNLVSNMTANSFNIFHNIEKWYRQ